MTDSFTSNRPTSDSPDMDEPILLAIQEYFGQSLQNLQRITEGQVAQTYSFTAAEREYILRINATMQINYEKELYAYRHFSSQRVPIPPVVHVGQIDNRHFAISEKVPGQTLMKIPPQEFFALIPQQIEVLHAIHQTPLVEQTGYGVFDGKGIGTFPSWQAYLAAIIEEAEKPDFFGKWHSLFEQSFLERDLFDALYQRMMQLSDYSPSQRYLVHGDYGFNNVLVHNGKISAVLDWMNAGYGDFLMDVAWLDFWSPGTGFQERFRQSYHLLGQEVPFYEERLLCYQCYIALSGLRFNAKLQNKPAYDWVRQRIHSLLPSTKHG